ncbi:transporter [Pontibacillus halophilus JSM 076056 = DSM 19796]|uniref:Transporter n=1 Tax=Pontibacillus halophilus JSM 076056 = DSM 19796 TaxID=1385510 RepID=A0A0A5GCP1_9BACI|nr:hypothetical protein [Pontibacillus halophilus]KGX90951.1 transporter [Pontibacillus halophilus JSM 076056 = DSM 19796]
MNVTVLKLVNVLSYIFLLVASFVLAGDIGGGTEDDVLFMPAGYAFSIWGLIYLLLFVFLVKQFFAEKQEEALIRKIGYWFPLSMILSGTSVIVGMTNAILFIAGSLVTLIITYSIITNREQDTTLFRIPFSFYLAWTSIATIVDTFVVLVGNDVTSLFGIHQFVWAIIMLLIGALLAVWFHIRNNDSIYPLVFVWGYVAIAVEQTQTALVFLSASLACLIALLVIVRVFKRSNK